MIKGARSLVEAEVLHKPDFRNSLLVVHVAMVGSDIKARALIDSGATHNFVSESWIERSKAATQQTERTIAVTLADGRRQVTPERKTLKSQKWCISELCWQESMTVISLSGYDMILGKPWLAEHNPVIDFSRNTIKVRAGEATFHLLAERSQPRKDDHFVDACVVELMSIKQARKALKRGAECIFLM